MTAIPNGLIAVPDLVDWGNPINWGSPHNSGLLLWCLSAPGYGGVYTTWRDLTGRNNGTLNLMDPKTDWFPYQDPNVGWGYLDFDGTDDFVTFGDPAHLSLNRTFSIFAMVRRDTSGSIGAIAGHGSGEWLLRFNASNQIEFLESQVASIGTGSTAITAGEWHWVGVSLDASGNGEFWLDGKSDGTFTTSNTLNDGSQGLKFACDTNGAGNEETLMNGAASMFKIYGRSFDVNQAAALHYQDTHFYPDLLNRPLLRQTGNSEQAAGGGSTDGAAMYYYMLNQG